MAKYFQRITSKRKRIMHLALVVLVCLFLVEIIALIWLYFSIGIYRNHWIERAKKPGELTYLALGDSAAQGIGATSPERGYVGLIARQLEIKTGKKIRVINLSVTGATVRDCIRDQIPKIKDIHADYVTIEIGANDVKANNLQQFKNDFSELIPLLPDGTYVSNMPLFNSRPTSTQPAKEQSKIIESLVKNENRLKFVDLQTKTEQHQSIFGFAPDLFHPNNLSYKNWYHAFWEEIVKN